MGMEALLIINMLNDFVMEGAPLEVPDTRKVLPHIKEEIEKARVAGKPVIYVCDAHEPDDREFSKMGWPPHAVKGTRGREVVDEIKPRKGDHIVDKTTYSGFYQSALDDLLKKLGVTDLRLTGCVTHVCVLFTAADASRMGYSVTVVEEGVAGMARADHEAALRIMNNVLGARIE